MPTNPKDPSETQLVGDIKHRCELNPDTQGTARAGATANTTSARTVGKSGGGRKIDLLPFQGEPTMFFFDEELEWLYSPDIQPTRRCKAPVRRVSKEARTTARMPI